MTIRFLLGLFAVVLLAAGCRNGAATDQTQTPPNIGEVRGRLGGVDAGSLLDLTSIKVTDAGGQVWTFDGGGYRSLEFTPSHLREHMTQGLAVTVKYRRDGESLVVVEIRD